MTDLINDDEISFPPSLQNIKSLFCDIVSFLERIITENEHKIDTIDMETENLKKYLLNTL